MPSSGVRRVDYQLEYLAIWSAEMLPAGAEDLQLVAAWKPEDREVRALEVKRQPFDPGEKLPHFPE